MAIQDLAVTLLRHTDAAYAMWGCHSDDCFVSVGTNLLVRRFSCLTPCRLSVGMELKRAHRRGSPIATVVPCRWRIRRREHREHQGQNYWQGRLAADNAGETRRSFTDRHSQLYHFVRRSKIEAGLFWLLRGSEVASC